MPIPNNNTKLMPTSVEEMTGYLNILMKKPGAKVNQLSYFPNISFSTVISCPTQNKCKYEMKKEGDTWSGFAIQYVDESENIVSTHHGSYDEVLRAMLNDISNDWSSVSSTIGGGS